MDITARATDHIMTALDEYVKGQPRLIWKFRYMNSRKRACYLLVNIVLDRFKALWLFNNDFLYILSYSLVTIVMENIYDTSVIVTVYIQC